MNIDFTDLAWVFSLLLVPAAVVLLDTLMAIRGLSRQPIAPLDKTVDADFEVVVPIWGSLSYLTNVDYLARYGSKVILCTTDSETAAFYSGLEEIARIHGFRTFRGRTPRRSGGPAGRQTSGVVRDRLVRDVHAILTAKFVVCIDADSRTVEPLENLVSRVASGGFDIVSVKVVAAPAPGLLARLQAHEYRAAMRIRKHMPWLVSGACHAGTRVAHREVMRRHSLFFQGNDVELGWIADGMKYRVGHVPFEVPTDVPNTFRSWWRQRYAWAGGEFRLFIMNPQLAVRHPFLWVYGAIISILFVPLRWTGIVHPDAALAATLVFYLAVVVFIHRRNFDWYVLLMPFYTLISNMILIPLGVVSYLEMAFKHRNVGLIPPKSNQPDSAPPNR